MRTQRPNISREAQDKVSQATESVSLKLRSDLRDGYEVQRAALTHGLDLNLLPRQVTEVVDSAVGTRAAFVHGVPHTSALSSVTFAQDQRMRRALLMRAGYRVPRGATFSVGEGKAKARRFAEKIGFPVVVKPAVGDNTIEVMTGIQNRRELSCSIEYLYTPPQKRKDYTRAAYSLTELRKPGRRGNRTVVPDGYEFLLEKEARGQYVRLLVLDGKVISCLCLPEGPWKKPKIGHRQDISSSVHPSIENIAVGATDAVHGIALAAVDLVVDDYTRSTRAEEAVIVEFSERPWLSAQYRINPALASAIGERILDSGLGGSGRLAERRKATTVTADIDLDGVVSPLALVSAFVAECERLGIVGETHIQDTALGRVSGVVQGHPERVAWILERLLDRGLAGERAMSVTVKQRENGSFSPQAV